MTRRFFLRRRSAASVGEYTKIDRAVFFFWRFTAACVPIAAIRRRVLLFRVSGNRRARTNRRLLLHTTFTKFVLRNFYVFGDAFGPCRKYSTFPSTNFYYTSADNRRRRSTAGGPYIPKIEKVVFTVNKRDQLAATPFHHRPRRSYHMMNSSGR